MHYSTFVPPRKTLTLSLCKTPSSLGAHYVSGFKTVGVCAFIMALLPVRFKSCLKLLPKIHVQRLPVQACNSLSP